MKRRDVILCVTLFLLTLIISAGRNPALCNEVDQDADRSIYYSPKYAYNNNYEKAQSEEDDMPLLEIVKPCEIAGIEFSPDGSKIAVLDVCVSPEVDFDGFEVADYYVNIRDLKTGRNISLFRPDKISGRLIDFFFNFDSDKLALSYNNTFDIRDVNTGENVYTVDITAMHGNKEYPEALICHYEREVCAVAWKNNIIELYSIFNADLKYTIKSPVKVLSLNFSFDGKYLVAGSCLDYEYDTEQCKSIVWTVDDRKEITTVKGQCGDRLFDVSPGLNITVCSDGYSINVFSISTGEALYTIEDSAKLYLKINEKKKLISAIDTYGRLSIFNAVNGRQSGKDVAMPLDNGGDISRDRIYYYDSDSSSISIHDLLTGNKVGNIALPEESVGYLNLPTSNYYRMNYYPQINSSRSGKLMAIINDYGIPLLIDIEKSEIIPVLSILFAGSEWLDISFDGNIDCSDDVKKFIKWRQGKVVYNADVFFDQRYQAGLFRDTFSDIDLTFDPASVEHQPVDFSGVELLPEAAVAKEQKESDKIKTVENKTDHFSDNDDQNINGTGGNTGSGHDVKSVAATPKPVIAWMKRLNGRCSSFHNDIFDLGNRRFILGADSFYPPTKNRSDEELYLPNYDHIRLIKFDMDGNILDETIIGDTEEDRNSGDEGFLLSNNVRLLSYNTNGFLSHYLLGVPYSDNTVTKQAAFKTDNGNEITRVNSALNDKSCFGISESSTGGYLCAECNAVDLRDGMFKIDDNGKEIWRRKCDDDFEDCFFITETENGDVFMGCTSAEDLMIRIIDRKGVGINYFKIKENNYSGVTGALIDNEKRIMKYSLIQSSPNTAYKLYLGLYDQNGNLIKQKEYSEYQLSINEMYQFMISATGTNDFFAAGFDSNCAISVMKFGSDLSHKWTKKQTLGYGSGDIVKTLPTSDGGLLILTSADSGTYPDHEENFYALKFTADGDVAWEKSSASSSYPDGRVAANLASISETGGFYLLYHSWQGNEMIIMDKAGEITTSTILNLPSNVILNSEVVADDSIIITGAYAEECSGHSCYDNNGVDQFNRCSEIWVAKINLAGGDGSRAPRVVEVPSGTYEYYLINLSKGALNLRKTPSLKGEVLEKLNRFRILTSLKETVTAEGHEWLKVKTTKDIIGWVSKSLITPAPKDY